MADKPVYIKRFNEELDLGARIAEGAVLGKIYLGVQGNDMDAAKDALEKTVHERLMSENHIKVTEIKMYDIIKDGKEDNFSGVSEIELLADEYRWFINTVLRYGPSAVEILEPAEIKLNAEQMHSIVADAADFSHIYSQQMIQMLKDPERRALYDRMMNEEQ